MLRLSVNTTQPSVLLLLVVGSEFQYLIQLYKITKATECVGVDTT